MAVSDGICRAGLHTESAENAAAVIDVVNRGEPLAAADPELVGVLCRLDIYALGGACGGAKEASDALFHAILVALQHMKAPIPLLENRRRIRVRVRQRGLHHFAKCDAHAFGDCSSRLEDFGDFGHSLYF